MVQFVSVSTEKSHDTLVCNSWEIIQDETKPYVRTNKSFRTIKIIEVGNITNKNSTINEWISSIYN